MTKRALIQDGFVIGTYYNHKGNNKSKDPVSVVHSSGDGFPIAMLRASIMRSMAGTRTGGCVDSLRQVVLGDRWVILRQKWTSLSKDKRSRLHLALAKEEQKPEAAEWQSDVEKHQIEKTWSQIQDFSRYALLPANTSLTTQTTQAYVPIVPGQGFPRHRAETVQQK
ncbi:hypothetical protein OF83DRAFT_1087710 [Amylostereum chailletii]|nr:hypothetical protein OF83DRAFT_1087710 [Amylostereum chailletii]